MDLSRLLRPRSIAVFGGKFAEAVIEQCDKIGFEGALWPVNPKRSDIRGHTCFKDASDLPGPPDAAFIGVNRHQTIEVLAALSAMGTGGATAFASGFKETGPEGENLQNAFIKAAGDMPVIGPNCYGLINYLDGALMWPDMHGGRRVTSGVAILAQSSNIAINLSMNRRGLPIAYLATLGNQAVVGLPALIEAFLDDPRVTAIGVHLEGLSDPEALAVAMTKAQAKGVPVVAIKSGKSEGGARLTFSHTASLSGSDAVIDAFFERLGIARVDTLSRLLETLMLLHVGGPLGGKTVVSMSCSGGEAALISDVGEHRGIDFRPFTPSDMKRISKTVSDLVTVSNPFDYHMFDWANEKRLKATFKAVMKSGHDLNILVLDFPREECGSDEDWHKSLRALQEAASETGSRAAVLATLPENMPERVALDLVAKGITPLSGIDDAMTAICAAAKFCIPPIVTHFKRLPGPKGDGHTLSEWQSKQQLAAFGVNIPQGRLCASLQEAMDAAAVLGYPLVVKAVGASLLHKTELNAVRLGIVDKAGVCAAAEELVGMGEGILVERMSENAICELIIGVNCDPVLGMYMLIGFGGILTETIADTRIILMPVDSGEILKSIMSLKTALLLSGHRGKPAADFAAIIDTVLAVQNFALEHAGKLIELDINPLIVKSDGAVAVDALIRLEN
ncbi:MAG: acetate--CoA ligase family protein [Rhodospirillales bacterium]|nr:acetate--CoA ligase family protein [Rhodospirillales bacterium]